MRSFPVYYGWVILAVAIVGMAATIPGQTAGISLFIDALIEELGLSRSAVSWAYTIATVAGALTLPLVGRWLDRYGPRRMVTLVTALFAAACVGMSQAHGWLSLLLGFVLLRGLGQGALALVNNHTVNLWFERRRGFVIGLLGIGMAVATAAFVPLMEQLLQQIGWQRTYVVLGGVLAVTMLPLGAFFYRAEPERFGLSVDGKPVDGKPPDASPDDASSDDAAPARPSEAVGGLSLAEAQRTRTFWLFAAGGVCLTGFGTGLLFHHFSLLGETGVGRPLAASFFVPFGVVTAASNLVTGWLVDRYSPRALLGVALLLFGLLLWFVPYVQGSALVWTYGSAFGIVQGMQNAVLGSAFAYYFGRAHHGAVHGFAKTILIGGTALGPPLLALGPDLLGSFAPVLRLLAPVALLLALAAFAAAFFRWDDTLLMSWRRNGCPRGHRAADVSSRRR